MSKTNPGKEQSQNEISGGYFSADNIGDKRAALIRDASVKTGFLPDEIISTSHWWGSPQAGAFHCRGQFEHQSAVLKIQTVKPNTSEITMITSFDRSNQSQVIRPPHLYEFVPWDDVVGYEALVLEDVGSELLLPLPATEANLKQFFNAYRDYRLNCLQSPWLDKPEASISEVIETRFSQWRKISFEIYPDHPLRQDDDGDLIDKTVSQLVDEYADVEPEFVHGHFSANDLFKVGDEIVVLSNLYWSWRPPLYDAVFGYHWAMLSLCNVEGVNPEMVDRQRQLWLAEIKSLPQTQTQVGSRMLDLALFERAAAGLNLDGLSLEPNNPVAEYLLEGYRKLLSVKNLT